MYRKITLSVCVITALSITFSFRENTNNQGYHVYYQKNLQKFVASQKGLLERVEKTDLGVGTQVEDLQNLINKTRLELKGIDFWLRYLEPISYKMINGPLPVEWETEVFEKYEKPYRREGAGLSLAWLYLKEGGANRDSLSKLLGFSIEASSLFYRDSIIDQLQNPSTFFLCNRLFLLNLAAIYTTGFECPDSRQIIPELLSMLESVSNIYAAFNSSFADYRVSDTYLDRFSKLVEFVRTQPRDVESFDHFNFIKDHVNPLFGANQQFIQQYNIKSVSPLDYSLSRTADNIFSKSLFSGQNRKGIYLRVSDPKVLAEIEAIGKTLFFDPILSGNNLRSCASCHKPNEVFTDTISTTSLNFDRKSVLPRNTPSLINVNYNHLLMLDGKHYTLQEQARAVITNPNEMACNENEMLAKVLSCPDYKKVFSKVLVYTPAEKTIVPGHVYSALTLYYTKFSRNYSPFDDAMLNGKPLEKNAAEGFNLFMSKAQCATCHFVPFFNGVKPPYVGSEFEVIGVPGDTLYASLSQDEGRHKVHPAFETRNAFRTGTVRNATRSKPYMHNGVFRNLAQVIEFYNGGGGAGRGLPVPNQTLSPDSLHLSANDKINLISFINSLNEDFETETPPSKLPLSKNKKLNNRRIGGEY